MEVPARNIQESLVPPSSRYLCHALRTGFSLALDTFHLKPKICLGESAFLLLSFYLH